MNGFINSIETFGLVDGPGIRTVVFMSGCKLRCLYCHNPEMWNMCGNQMTTDELLKKIISNKPYYKRNNGGVTFSGGEPLLQKDFLLAILPKLKEAGIHVALDTSGVGIGDYDKVLTYTDLVILDIKHTNTSGYEHLTGYKMDEVENFIKHLNNSHCEVWLRQVIVPGLTDQKAYIDSLKAYIKKINNVTKVEFLPFHHLGFSKYIDLNIPNPLLDTPEMDKDACEKLYAYFKQID
mgnify:FL=1